MAVRGSFDKQEMRISPRVQEALLANAPVVALESAVITHGLPFPRNMETALLLESTVAAEGATAATVGIIDGRIHVGLTEGQLQRLSSTEPKRKISVRDIALAVLDDATGGTTVAATLFAAGRAGIRVFATGGIGGVHRESKFDVSADLAALARTRMIVVCAGAKAILDLFATMEVLETMSVPVIGYGTDDLPAFYSPTSGIKLDVRLNSPLEIARYWTAHCALGMESAVLIANPIPDSAAIPTLEMEGLITKALREASAQAISGQQLTPFLLHQIGILSGGRAINANVALLQNNARLAARIATALIAEHQGKDGKA